VDDRELEEANDGSPAAQRPSRSVTFGCGRQSLSANVA
jgi:hypothetical protein